MKRFICILTAMSLCVAMFVSCGKTVEAKWQEQLDLGMRYLEEMDYDSAILAFTKAIEVDPNRSEAYVERAELYVQRGAEGDLSLAAADYEKAIELGEKTVDIFLALADIYLQQGDTERAMEVLQQGYDLTESDLLKDKLEDMRSSNTINLSGQVLQKTVYEDGEAVYIYTYTYNEDGYNVRFDCECLKEGEEDYYGVVEEFSENGAPYRYNYYSADGTPLETWDIMTFNDQQQEIRREKYWGGESSMASDFFYDDQGRQTGWKCYLDGVLESYSENTYDENGRLTGEIIYNPDGTVRSQSVFQ